MPTRASHIHPRKESALQALREDLRSLWPFLVLALVVRMAYLYFHPHSPFSSPVLLDQGYYHQWALQWMSGHWPKEIFYGLPLYPAYLAILYKLFAANVYVVKTLALLAGVGAVVFIYLLAKHMFGKRCAMLASALYILYGPFLFYECLIIPESIVVFMYSAVLWVGLVFLERPNIKLALLCGALMGVACLLKAGMILFGLILAVWVFWRKPQNRLAAVLFLGVFAGALGMITLHNWYWGRDFVFLSSHSGFNFYIGNHPGATGAYHVTDDIGTNVQAQRNDSRRVAEKALGKTLKESEVSAYWSDQAKQYIQQNPGSFLKLCLKKAALLWDRREISDVADYEFEKRYNAVLRVPWADFTWVGPLALLGLILLAITARIQGLHRIYILSFIVSYSSGVILYFINARYRLPLMPAMILMGSYGLDQLLSGYQRFEIKKIIFYLVIIGVGFWIGSLRLVDYDPARDYVNAADIFLEKQDPEAAMPYLEKALEINPLNLKANLAMGLALSQAGQSERAQMYYQKVLELKPDEYQSLNNLGLMSLRQGQFEQAENYLLRADAAKPGAYFTQLNLGVLYGQKQQYQRALNYFQSAIQADPSSAKALCNAALMEYKLGNKTQALLYWRQALAVQPQYPDAVKALSALGEL